MSRTAMASEAADEPLQPPMPPRTGQVAKWASDSSRQLCKQMQTLSVDRHTDNDEDDGEDYDENEDTKLLIEWAEIRN